MKKFIDFIKSNWKVLWFAVAAFCFLCSLNGSHFWWIAFQISVAPITITLMVLILCAGLYAAYLIVKCIIKGSWKEFEELFNETK